MNLGGLKILRISSPSPLPCLWQVLRGPSLKGRGELSEIRRATGA